VISGSQRKATKTGTRKLLMIVTVISGSQRKTTKTGTRKLLMIVMVTATDALKISHLV
jgi:hypothetical protein